jgi:uncharacterized membrane protein
MADRDLLGVATTAKVAGHPLHPMLIPFPITLLIATFICDLAYWSTGDAFWARVAMWALGAAIVTAAAAAAAGLADFFGNSRIQAMSDAWHHMIGNVVAVVLALVSFWLRYRYGAAEAIVPWGLVLSTLIVLMLGYTGWKGGDLVYKHRIGMHPEEPASATSHHLEGTRAAR